MRYADTDFIIDAVLAARTAGVPNADSGRIRHG
jgi:hypothetical protein